METDNGKKTFVVRYMGRSKKGTYIVVDPKRCSKEFLSAIEVDNKINISIGPKCKLKGLVKEQTLSDDLPPYGLIVAHNCLISLPININLFMVRDEAANRYHIGPILGILTTNTKLLFGSQRGTIRDLINIGRKHGVMVYAFTPDDINWSAKTIKGYYAITAHDKATKWVRRHYPFPDVVYNRISTRSEEARSDIAQIKLRLKETNGVRVFNTRFLNKWEVHRSLSSYGRLDESVIETARFRNSGSLMSFLDKYGQIFLKPVASSLGNGAMRVKRLPKGFSWEMNIPGKGTRRRIVASGQSLCSLVSKGVGRKPYLIQKCINLVRYEGRPFDVRVLVQKDESAEWKVTGMAARIARKDRITTHIPNGGKARPLLATLTTAFKETEIDPEKVERKIEKTAVLAAEAIDTKQNLDFGELSLDIGVDKEGNAWIFEVNSKPFRFDEEKIRRLALRRVLGYTYYLSGFNVP